MKLVLRSSVMVFWALVFVTALGCTSTDNRADEQPGSDTGDDTGSETVVDTSVDTETDTETDTSNNYDGPAIPQTCEQAAEANTTVGCLFYAVDLDSTDDVEVIQQYAVVVANVNDTETATVEVLVKQGSDWAIMEIKILDSQEVYAFMLPDLHMNTSGVMPGGAYKVVSDVPVVAYQFSPADGSISYLSDASMLLPVSSLSRTYEMMGWKRNMDTFDDDGTMRAYFTVVAVSDGTEVTVTPAVSPLAAGEVPSGVDPFVVSMSEGDVLEVQSDLVGDSMMGSKIVSNEGHPISVFSGQECAYIPETVCCCDHLEEQMPGLRFWGQEVVAARMPTRNTGDVTDAVLWQVFASEDETVVEFSASPDVVGIPSSPTTMNGGEYLEFYVHGTNEQPGDFLVSADKPIAVMQYMIGAQNPNVAEIGDPAMAYVPPVDQFLPRYIVVVPFTWVNDYLVLTRKSGTAVYLDEVLLEDSVFEQVGESEYEVARILVGDGIHRINTEDDAQTVSVTIVGFDLYDSYAYIGGMGLAPINVVIE